MKFEDSIERGFAKGTVVQNCVKQRPCSGFVLQGLSSKYSYKFNKRKVISRSLLRGDNLQPYIQGKDNHFLPFAKPYRN